MEKIIKIGVYGDSIMRATVPDENLRYHFRMGQFMERLKGLPLKVVNRARFGATVTRGETLLEKDLVKGAAYDVALIEYGGNDCDYDWEEVAADPTGTHLPHTELPRFVQTVEKMADALRAQGTRPVLMTLPPIDARRYFEHIISKGVNRENLLLWLGDINMIYRFHELYSNAIERLAAHKNLLCVDVRSAFLARRDCARLISRDGIHPTSAGYRLIYRQLLTSVRRFGKSQFSAASQD